MHPLPKLPLTLMWNSCVVCSKLLLSEVAGFQHRKLHHVSSSVYMYADVVCMKWIGLSMSSCQYMPWMCARRRVRCAACVHVFVSDIHHDASAYNAHYTRSPIEESCLFGPSPWKILATTYEKNDF